SEDPYRLGTAAQRRDLGRHRVGQIGSDGPRSFLVSALHERSPARGGRTIMRAPIAHPGEGRDLSRRWAPAFAAWRSVHGTEGTVFFGPVHLAPSRVSRASTKGGDTAACIPAGQRPLAAAGWNRYKPAMRRATRLGLAVLIPLLVLLGAYTAYWLIVAGRIKEGFVAWAQSERAEKIDVSWQSIGVTGFPFGWRVALERTVLRDGRVTPPPELRIPALLASARPWDFATWQLAALEGVSAALAGAGERPALKLTAQTAAGVLTAGQEAGTTVWLSLRN